MRVFRKFYNTTVAFDFFGTEVSLSLDGNKRVKSKMGGMVSLTIMAFALYFLIQSLINSSNLENLTTTSSTKHLEINSLCVDNQSFSYEFDYTNFRPTVTALAYSYDPPVEMNHTQLSRYFSQNFVYINKEYQLIKLGFEPCQINQTRKYLEIDQPTQDISEYAVCIPKSFNMGLFADPANQQVLTPSITYELSKCVNTTENNNFCASEEEIEEMAQYVWIEMNIPKTVYDFSNSKHPRSHSLTYKPYHIDYSLRKQYSAFLKPQYLYTDQGAIKSDYRLDSVDFSVDDTINEVLIRTSKDTVLFHYEFAFGFFQEYYYRENQKIYVIFANLGGLVNLLILAGKLFCTLYNNMIFEHKMINHTFTNLENFKENPEKENESVKKKDGFNFNFLFFFFPWMKAKRWQTLSEARTEMNDYLDLAKIVKKLQDVEKMKMVLFDASQRKVFENLPKFGIEGRNTKKRSSSILSTKSVRKSITITSPNDLQVEVETLKKKPDNPINQRLVEIIEPTLSPRKNKPHNTGLGLDTEKLELQLEQEPNKH